MRPRMHAGSALVGLALAVAACGSSAASPSAAAPSPVPSPTADVSAATTPNAMDAYPFLAAYEGQFAGSWKNATFGSTGSMAWDITADPDARTIKIKVTVGGRFLGGPGAPAETILLTHLADGVIEGTSPTFGQISGTITPEGALQIALSNVPGGAISKVEINGTFTGGDSISISYAVEFTAGGGKATGAVTLSRT